MQKIFTDQLGRKIAVPALPRRIISLVPSVTELLFDLGLDEEIVGLTNACVHPKEKTRARTRVGDRTNLDIQQITSLSPDLIIAGKDENNFQELELLSRTFPVWICQVRNLEEAMEMITGIAFVLQRQPEAAYLNHLIGAGFRDLQLLGLELGLRKKVAFFPGEMPLKAVGRDTFANDLLTKIGLTNVITSPGYPAVSSEMLRGLEPDLVFHSSAGDSPGWPDSSALFPQAEVRVVDGEMIFSYGSRLVKAVQYLFQLQASLI